MTNMEKLIGDNLYYSNTDIQCNIEIMRGELINYINNYKVDCYNINQLKEIIGFKIKNSKLLDIVNSIDVLDTSNVYTDYIDTLLIIIDEVIEKYNIE